MDIFRTADILTNGAVDIVKARSSIGNLSFGLGVLHDFYPYPEIANDVMKALLNESRLKVSSALLHYTI